MLSDILDQSSPLPFISARQAALAVLCVARHSRTREEMTETCAMLGLDRQPPEPKTWDSAAGRGVPDSFRRGKSRRRG